MVTARMQGKLEMERACRGAAAGIVLFGLFATPVVAHPTEAAPNPPLAASSPAPAPLPPLGRAHLLLEAGRIDVDDAAAREWGVDREGFFALALYLGDERGLGYLGGEIGHAGTRETTNSDGDRIEDFDFDWIEINTKRAFDLHRGWSADVGFGGAFFYVDGQEVSVQGGEEIRDPLADIGFGLQIVGDVSWRARRLLLGVDLHYQWAFDLLDVDYSNFRFGAHVGVAF